LFTNDPSAATRLAILIANQTRLYLQCSEIMIPLSSMYLQPCYGLGLVLLFVWILYDVLPTYLLDA